MIAIKDGKLQDSSAPMGPINFEAFDIEFRGRQVELYKLFNLVKDDNVQLINLYGDQGLGKKGLIKELARYVTVRDVFSDGVLYFNLEKFKTEAETKQIFKNSFNTSMKNASILVILANIDTIDNKTKTFMYDVELLLR